jgi:hypothetical protein
MPETKETRQTYSRQDAESWKDATGMDYQTIIQSVDRPEFRYRLWSIQDNPILYYFYFFNAALKARASTMHSFSAAPISIGSFKD